MIYEARAVSRTFAPGASPVRAVDGVTFEVDEGEFVAVTGPSGCGKTSLLHVLGLLDPGYTGDLRFRGALAAGLGDAARARIRLESVGFVFQAFHLLASLDVRDNVALPYWRLHGGKRAARTRAEELLADLGLGRRLRHSTRDLSGGEMQRVALARALVNSPAVVIADEPTGNLDSESAAAVLSLFARVGAEGRTVVVASHDPSVVALARRTIALRDGRIVSDVRATTPEASGSR